jgi:hypothetical protein
MAGFGGGKAVASGFRLIAREPLAVLAWAGVYLVLGILPQAAIWPKMAQLMQTSGGELDERMLAELNASMLAYQPVIWLCSILMYTLVYGAIYRAILEPDSRRYFYLRLGMQELWMLLSSAVVLILGIIAIFIAAIPIGIVGASAGQGAGATGLTFLLACAVFLLFFWLAMRFALAGVIAFAQRRFVLLESWRLTRGYGLKMMGAAFVLFCMVLGVELVFGLAAFLSLYPMLNGGEAALTKALSDPETLVRRWAPWLVVLCLLGSIVVAAFYAVLAAPWASIYRDLTGGEAPAGS